MSKSGRRGYLADVRAWKGGQVDKANLGKWLRFGYRQIMGAVGFPMPRRKRRGPIGKDEIDVLATRLFKVFLEGSKKDLVCYLPPGLYKGSRIWGPDVEWNSDRDKRRDSEFCDQIRRQTRSTVGACFYDVPSSPSKNGVWKPFPWIRDVYGFAKKGKYERLHLVGYSGGAMLASSQLAFHPPRPERKDPSVRTLVLIAGDVAAGRDRPHRNAAYFADGIDARTLLIWGTKDEAARLGAQMWKERNSKADTSSYDGGHNFYDDGRFDNVTRMVVDWLMKEPAIKRLAKRKAHDLSRH